MPKFEENKDLVTKRERRAYLQGYLEGVKLYSFLNKNSRWVVGEEKRSLKDALLGVEISLRDFVKEGLE